MMIIDIDTYTQPCTINPITCITNFPIMYIYYKENVPYSHSMLPLSFKQQCYMCTYGFKATDTMKLVEACSNDAYGFHVPHTKGYL